MIPSTDAALQPTPSLSWGQVWVKALTQPSVATYEALVRDPAAGTGRAVVWVAVSSLISFGLLAVGQLTIGAMFGSEFEELMPFGGLGRSTVLFLACGAPIIVLLSVAGLIIDAGITQFVAGLLGGVGSFRSLAYELAAYIAPLSVVSSALSIIPVVSLCLTIPLGIYGIVLNVIAVKAVNQFDWGKAVISAWIIPILLIVLSICAIVVLVLLAVPIGEVFSEIQRGLQAP